MTVDSGSFDPSNSPDACWRRIGIWGDRTCDKLADHIHCRQCPAWSSAAGQLLRESARETDIESHTTRIAAPVIPPETNTQSAIAFRLGANWFALPIERFREITGRRVIHTIPGRQNAVRGLVNIRGQLLVCIALETILGLPQTDAAPTPTPTPTSADGERRGRFMVLGDPNGDVVVPVDDVPGIINYSPEKLEPISETDRDAGRHIAGGLSIDERLIAILRPDRVFESIHSRFS